MHTMIEHKHQDKILCDGKQFYSDFVFLVLENATKSFRSDLVKVILHRPRFEACTILIKK
jgi:hypothetical protein